MTSLTFRDLKTLIIEKFCIQSEKFETWQFELKFKLDLTKQIEK